MEITKNNHDSMKTVVETFLIEENIGLIYDGEALQNWEQKVKELGLTGQQKLQEPGKTPLAFMHMKKGLVNIFETLCPRKTEVETFSITPIPLEILDLIALAKRENMFKRIEIWYDDQSPDPVCIGIKSEYQLYGYDCVPKEAKLGIYPSKEAALDELRKYKPDFSEKLTFGWETNGECYLIGKWADVKHSLEELKDLAMKRRIKEIGATLHKKIKEAQLELNSIVEDTEIYFS